MLTKFVICFWNYLYMNILRPMYKRILRKWTGQPEILRITYAEAPGAARTRKIEKSFKWSFTPLLKHLYTALEVDVTEVVPQVMELKQILPEVHPHFADTLSISVSQICGYKKLLAKVEALRKERYDSDNDDHETKLLNLWDLMMPGTELQQRIWKQWTEIGFQGKDPRTDFRGMGILGLDQLLYLAKVYPNQAKHLLSQSQHPQYGFSYAIVGINMTDMCYNLLKLKRLRGHFYNLRNDAPELSDFHEVYCYVFVDFVTFWFDEKPKDIMEFERLKDKYQKKMMRKLKNRSTLLVANFKKRDS
ncbi:ELMO domain-containing protein 1-like [Gigantopelta aegis]|uniref:ELMO domain-containing protein 1-like n=1 Tax=Gigantopelta aegis TaxID=1735272 RepID=UPI001B887C24|nr:ELMO domain-containing protein 1-like [Gigantopelta aegis]XP_041358918.1 ELMO domain-containing protein 1-like [Gigantopelta aegis]XP_041358919.1 ELMO domain-containing protein 1-like [Gigantopelta aegis]XP_041358920.1 ELMO domain-containing protein 1-like [Gigantopelta aegis]